MNANPLIAEDTATPMPQSSKIFYGIYKAGGAYGQVVTQGKVDLGDIASSTFSVGLDVLSFISNPFKHLMQAGVSWAFEHVAFLREPLDWVAGNPNAIEGLAQTWNNIAMALHEASTAWMNELQSTANWDGADADAYRQSASAFGEVINGAADGAASTANFITGAGVLVSITRTMLLEIISNFIAEAVLWLLSSMASAGLTFGASLAAGVARVVSKAVSVFADMVAKIGELMTKLGRWVVALRKFGTGSTGLTKSLDDATDHLLKGSGKFLTASGPMLGRGSDRLRNLSDGALMRSWDPLKNSWKNPIDGLKTIKYTGNSLAVGENNYSKMEAEREANGGP
ncbi:WXG100-like domain-containing protein [Glycomyces tarimensis]